MSTTVNTLPSVPAEISVSDLGAMLSGETPSAHTPDQPTSAPVPASAAAAPAKADAPEAAAVETPAPEPEKKIEAEEQTAETKQEPPKEEKSWVDKRLSQSAKRRREAEAIALAERQRAEELQRKLEALEANPGPKQPPAAEKTPETAAPAANGKPVLQTFIDALKEGEPYETAVERYQDARDDWRDNQRKAEDARKAQAEQQEEQNKSFQKDWTEALERHPDFDDVVARVRSATPEGLQVAITQVLDGDGHPLWPDVTLYLDEHPEEMKAIVQQHKRNPLTAAASLGRIAGSISKASTPAPVKAATTKALPKPPAVLGGVAAPAPIDLEKADMATFAREVVKYL